MGALSGLKVVEVSHVLAGPYCGYQLALLGAEVIKVELPSSPDCARGRGPITALNEAGLGLNYQVQGGNKRSLAIDLRQQKGQEALLKICQNADIFLENYTQGTLQNHGFGYQDLNAINEEIVYCSMTGYGGDCDSTAKHSFTAKKGAYDNTIQAVSGVIGQCKGVKPGVSFVDYAAGLSAGLAITSAIIQRSRTGRGCYISASMLEVAMSLMSPEVAAHQVTTVQKKTPEPGINSYQTQSGVLMLGAFKPSQYQKLGSCLKAQGFDLPLLSDIYDWPAVKRHSSTLNSMLSAIFIQRTADEWVSLFDKHNIPAEKVLTLSEAIHSPQLAARGYFVPSPNDDKISLPLAGYKFSEGGPHLHSAPPALGADSRAVLKEHGFEDKYIDQLYIERVLL